MGEVRMACGVCGGVFSEHEIGLNPVDPEEDQVLCPNCGSARLEPYPFDPDAPVEELVEEEEV
jgi:ribosomal protein S27AE